MSSLRKASVVTLLGSLAFMTSLIVSMSAPVHEAEAQSVCGVETDCGLISATKGFSALTVRHEEVLYSGNEMIQITGTDVWDIEVTYLSADDDNSPTCSCDEPIDHPDHPFLLEVEVEMLNTGWAVDCTAGCDPVNGPVYDVHLCALTSSSCAGMSGGAAVARSHAYKLVVEADLKVSDPCPGGTGDHFLYNVEYTATPSDGVVLDMAECTVGTTTKTPIFTTYTNNDGGDFECKGTGSVACGASGPEILLSYE